MSPAEHVEVGVYACIHVLVKVLTAEPQGAVHAFPQPSVRHTPADTARPRGYRTNASSRGVWCFAGTRLDYLGERERDGQVYLYCSDIASLAVRCILTVLLITLHCSFHDFPSPRPTSCYTEYTITRRLKHTAAEDRLNRGLWYVKLIL